MWGDYVLFASIDLRGRPHPICPVQSGVWSQTQESGLTQTSAGTVPISVCRPRGAISTLAPDLACCPSWSTSTQRLALLTPHSWRQPSLAAVSNLEFVHSRRPHFRCLRRNRFTTEKCALTPDFPFHVTFRRRRRPWGCICGEDYPIPGRPDPISSERPSLCCAQPYPLSLSRSLGGPPRFVSAFPVVTCCSPHPPRPYRTLARMSGPDRDPIPAFVDCYHEEIPVRELCGPRQDPGTQ